MLFAVQEKRSLLKSPSDSISMTRDFVTHPQGGEGKQTCTVTCMDREWFPEKPELGAENQKSNYLL